MELLIQFIQRNKITFILLVSALVSLALIACVYLFRWSWTGFLTKNVWDWLQLLVIPVGLAIIAVWFNHAERSSEQKATIDSQRETILQAYFDKLSELLPDAFTYNTDLDPKILTIIRAHTLTTLKRLDADRKTSLLSFLEEIGLFRKINLEGADMSGVNLRAANLRGIKLRKVNLSGANLQATILSDAELLNANLNGANLSGAMMIKTDLRGADLSDANLTGAILREVYIHGATYKEKQFKKVQSIKDLKK